MIAASETNMHSVASPTSLPNVPGAFPSPKILAKPAALVAAAALLWLTVIAMLTLVRTSASASTRLR
jgi:hypothetical protein